MSLSEFIIENKLEIEITDDGLSLCFGSKKLTPVLPSMADLAEEVQNHGEAIKMAKQVEEPSKETIQRYLTTLDKTLPKLDQAKVEHQKMLGRISPDVDVKAFIEWAKENAPDDLVLEMVLKIQKTIDNHQPHRDTIEKCRKLAQESPSRIALPLGAKVRLRKDWDIPEHYGLDARLRWGILVRPVAGSIGYVTGTGYGSDECSIVVSFVGPVETTDNGTHTAPLIHGLTKVVNADDVEVLELATFMDGTENYSPDPIATHREVYDETDHADAMILLCGNRVIEIFVEGNPLDEGVNFYRNVEEIKDLQPLEASTAPRP